MKKTFLIVLSVILAVAVVSAIVLLVTSRTGTEIQNTEPEPMSKNTQTQISESENFWEKIGARADSDGVSILERKEPLDIFESLRQQKAENEITADSEKASLIPSVRPIPTVESVSPALASDGDTVTVTGSNFTPTGNTVILSFALLGASFPNLASPDGKTISFIYASPALKPISQSALDAIPDDIKETLNSQLAPHKLTLNDLAKDPFMGIKSQSELEETLGRYGYSLKNLEDPYVVAVENANGRSQEMRIVLQGMRKYKIGDIANNSNTDNLFSAFFSTLREQAAKLLVRITPAANAQFGIPAGGFHAAIVWWCTCSAGYMSVIVGYGPSPSGLYHIAPWTRSLNITTKMPGTFFLGSYLPGASQCFFWVPNIPAFCVYFPGNFMSSYGGSH